MTLRARLVFSVVAVAIFSLTIAFRMVMEGFTLKLFTAICGAWLISKAHYCLTNTSARSKHV
jgi:hypothetical protein